MGHKVHPIGFRLGVPLRGSLTAPAGAYAATGDLLGTSSRWVVNSVERRGAWTIRDRSLRSLRQQWLLDDGYVRNKCLIYRWPSQTAIYVDAYELQDRSLVSALYGDQRPAEVDAGTVGPTGSGGPTGTAGLTLADREDFLSRFLEEGRPVTVQRSTVNRLLEQVPATVWTERSAKLSPKTTHREDLLAATALLALLPSTEVFAQVVALRRGGGRLQSVVCRSAQAALEGLAQSELGLQRPAASVLSSQGRHRLIRTASTRSLPRLAPGDHLLARVVGARVTRLPGAKETAGASSSERGVINASDARFAASRPAGGFLGYRLEIAGRIGGSERKKVLRWTSGSRPRQTLSAPLDYARSEAKTARGVVSVKLWICYG